MYHHIVKIVGRSHMSSAQFTVNGHWFDSAIKAEQEPFILTPSYLLQHYHTLEKKSEIGFIGLPYQQWQAGLNSCVGRWGGCIPTSAPALVYHHGAAAFTDESNKHFRERAFDAVKLWMGTLSGALL